MKLLNFKFLRNSFASKFIPNRHLITFQNRSSSNLNLFRQLQLENVPDYPQLKSSQIRQLNIGYDYFKLLLPKRKKILMTLYDAYLEVLTSNKEKKDFQISLELFYHAKLNNENFLEADDKHINFSDDQCWHFYAIMVLERIASQYSRFEYLSYHPIIKTYNNLPKHKRMRVKYVFTSHPTQPNSMEQLACISKIFKGLEQNDRKYLGNAMKDFRSSFNTRVFKKPTYVEESTAYHTEYLTNMIKAVSRVHELGLREPSDFIETPGTWLTFDFDNHPEMETGLMTFTHALCLQLTINEYLAIIDEAGFSNNIRLNDIFFFFERIKKYAQELRILTEKLKNKEISKIDFFHGIPMINLYDIEKEIRKELEIISIESDTGNKLKSVSIKIVELLKVFHLNGCTGQIRFSGESLYDPENNPEIINDIMEEISILNKNCCAADMIIIANYEQKVQYQNIKNLLQKKGISNIEIVPLLETFASTNATNSKITMIASSDTRQRDGLLLTELRNFTEYVNNPEKFIFMGQGVTPERGGGPFALIQKKYAALTKAQRIRHIRTIQGHYFAAEFASSDLVFTFLLAGTFTINSGEHFEPTKEYMEFLFELDNIVGVPQRELQKTSNFNSFYVKNNIVRTLTENFNYAGSREKIKNLTNVKGERAIVQAYINSDRCSFTHPELAYWNRVNDQMVEKMAKHYYSNNLHFKYILYMYAFLVKRADLAFAKGEIGLDTDNPTFIAYVEGKKALEQILNYLGVHQESLPLKEIWNQHLGLSNESSDEEAEQKYNAIKVLVKLQNYYCRKYLKDERIGIDSKSSLYRMRIFQSALANVSPFSGKG